MFTEVDGCLVNNGGCHPSADCIRAGPNVVRHYTHIQFVRSYVKENFSLEHIIIGDFEVKLPNLCITFVVIASIPVGS